MKYFVHTFGCKSNQYESQAIRENLDRNGFSESDRPDDASVFIINTCGVTGRAVASCRNAIRKAARGRPGPLVVITGCGVDLNEAWPKLSPEPVLVPNARKHAIAELVRARLAGTPAGDVLSDPFRLRISSFRGHTRAFLKIQDGCDNFCAYCAVPFARGKPNSRPHQEVFDEACRLVQSGYRELVLTGINIGVYRDGRYGLADLASRLAETAGLERLRLGSVEPPHVDAELASAMRANPGICPHIHLPLQSGSDRVLSLMGRRYSSAGFLDKVAMLKAHLMSPAITTDVMVGFPGEEEEDCRRSLELCEKAGFSRLHVFPFSPRPGTAAATMLGSVPHRVVEERKSELIRAGRILSEKFAQNCVGMEERVIVERAGLGLSDRYVKIRATPILPGGTAARVRIISAFQGELDGVAVE